MRLALHSKVLATTALVALAATPAAGDTPTYEASIAYGAAVADDQVPAMEAFKHYVEVATDGDMVITITTMEALGGDDREVVDQTRLGELEFNASVTGGAFAGVFPSVSVWNWPFMFPGRHVSWSLFQDPEYRRVVDQLVYEQSGGTLRWLGAAENSIRNLYSTHGPIRTPSDLAEFGTKIRTMQIPMHQEVWAQMGAGAVVALPTPERYTAKQTGMIDATEGGLMSAWNAGLLEVSDYVTLTGHMYDFHSYVVNADFFDSLPADYQQAVTGAAIIATRIQDAYAYGADAEALQLILDDGNTVYEPTAAEVEQWRAAAEPVARRFIEETANTEFIDATLAAVDRIAEAYRVQPIGGSD
jgi:TRAP-type C4-dicarboxylate transport system substrate-binding protein